MARVLIAEDDPDLCWIWSETLADCGHEVQTVEDGAAARVALDAGRYDLMICDILMPGDGAIVLAPLARAAHPGIRVLAVTGRLDFEQDLSEAVPGADRTLRKPIGLEQLCRTVRDLVGRAADPAYSAAAG